MSSLRQYSDLQLFVLAFLATVEQEQEERGEAFGRPHSDKLPLTHRNISTVNELSLKIPPSFIPNQPSGKEMLSNVQAQIDELKTDRLLHNDPQFLSHSILENTITD